MIMRYASSTLGDRLPSDYLDRLSDQDKLDAVRACLIVSEITGGRVVPRVFQLEASVAMLNRRDCVVVAGSGKTLYKLIPLLLRPGSLLITVSPSKRLQTTQVLEGGSYGIKTIAINEDTPNDEALWRSIGEGYFQHLVVSPEQLGTYNDNEYFPRLARLLRENRTFVKSIDRVNVDEAHNIHTAGLPHYGEAAFRPAYGMLGHLRLHLSMGVPMQALSAMLPDHFLATIKTQLALSSSFLELRLISNRPNITYATLPITGSPRNFENLSFLVPSTFHPPMFIPKTLIFHDSSQNAGCAAAFMNSRLPECLRDSGIVKHYHSDMSSQYLQQTFEDFHQPNSTCRILHATAESITGLDIRGVTIVIQYGVCKNMAEAAQCVGWAARDPNSTGLFLTMAEPWAIELSFEGINVADPDQPLVRNLNKNSSKQDRTSVASIRYVQSQTCLRESFATYLGDKSPQALNSTGLWCCDRHHDAGFDLNRFFHGKVYAGSIPEDSPQADSATTDCTRIPMRAPSEQEELLDLLIDWREQAHERNCFSPITWIVDDSDLGLVSRTHPSSLSCLHDLVDLLKETEDWAQKYGHEMIKIVTQFETTVAPTRERISASA